MSVVGERLKLLREEHKLTQSDFAFLMSVNRMTVNNYETGKRNPDIAFVANASDYFSVSLEYLCGKSEFKNQEGKLNTIQKCEELFGLMENIPQVEGQQMMTGLTTLLDRANENGVNMPILLGLISTVNEYNKIITKYIELENNIKMSVGELKWQNIQPALILWACNEKAIAMSEHTLEGSKALQSAIQLSAKMLQKKLQKTLEAEIEK